MLEGVLYFALGFLSAALLAIMVAPAIWRRAVVLTRKRIESSVPLTLNEIQADKDQLRAEFAMSTRRLEMSLEELKDKAADQMIEVNRKRDEMADLSDEFQAKSETVTELETKGAELRANLVKQEEQLANTRDILRNAEQRLEQRASELEALELRYQQSTANSAGQQIELVAKETQMANLKDKVDDAGRKARASRDVATDLKSEMTNLRTRSKNDQRKVQDVEKRLSRVQSTLADREEKLERRERELAKKREDASVNAGKIGDVKKLLSKEEAARLKLEAELAKSTLRMEALLRDASGENVEKALAVFDRDKKILQKKLLLAEKTRDKLEKELVAAEKNRGEDWETERRENAVVRERMNDLAAQVTSMTATLEGNGSTIREILQIDKVPRSNKAAAKKSKSTMATDISSGSSLADRIRALQTAADDTAANL